MPTKRKPKLEVVKPEPVVIEGLPFAAELEDLQRWYRLNKRAEVARMRLNKQNESFVAFQFGYSTFLPDDERKAKLKQVQDALGRYEKGEPMGLPGGAAMDDATAEMMKASQPAIEGLLAAEKRSRREMEKIVAKLPGGDCPSWAGNGWIDSTMGVSLYGYACILGLLGDPRQYELEDGTIEKTTPQGLRRYIGLAPKSSYQRADDGEGAAMRPGNKLAVLYFKIGDGMLSLMRPQNTNGYRDKMMEKLAEVVKREPIFTAKGTKVEFAKPDNKSGASAYAIKLATRYAMARWLTDLWRIWHGQQPRDIDLTSTKRRAA